MHPYRSHTCNALSAAQVGSIVKLSGWVHRKRDHGQLLFIDLRDHYGITQLVANADQDKALCEALAQVRFESVITVEGKVLARMPETINKDLPTGEIEIAVTSYTLESAADVLPLQVNSDAEFPEDTRLTYRFLDLRREKLHRNILLRSQVIASLRRRMTENGFNEFQTPILTASSPEGARDYLVPSRVHPGKFYALPQAPQMFKQLLMVAGFDRYFQIAPCFRDEDARADRSPGEFYQLDIEMSFVTQDDVFAAIEPVLHGVFKEFGTKTVTDFPFPRIAYRESMLKYGSDKPDLRNPLVIADAGDVFKGSGFGIFNKVLESGGIIRAIPAPKTADHPTSSAPASARSITSRTSTPTWPSRATRNSWATAALTRSTSRTWRKSTCSLSAESARSTRPWTSPATLSTHTASPLSSKSTAASRACSASLASEAASPLTPLTTLTVLSRPLQERNHGKRIQIHDRQLKID